MSIDLADTIPYILHVTSYAEKYCWKNKQEKNETDLRPFFLTGI